ncbi:unnamed protein product [Discula destructiva]
MFWGWANANKATPPPPPPLHSLLGQLLPLVILFAIAAAAAWVGYQVYLSVTQMKGNVSQKMGKKNVVFTKDGLKVGVKHVQQEGEIDATQRYLVNAWNLSSNKDAANKKSK